MPELPDIETYLHCLRARLDGEPLYQIRLASPFVLRSVEPAPASAQGRRVTGLSRLGKRIIIALQDELYLVIHLMIAGRLRWEQPAVALRRPALAAFDFPAGTLLLTEAGSKKRASLHLVSGEEGLTAHDPGGIELAQVDVAGFREAMTRQNHTLKRSLSDPRILSGIGNAYSDEILHRAGMSPFKQTARLTDDEWGRLFRAAREVLEQWTERLKGEVGDGFPHKVTAFREDFAVHGRYRKPCPVCGSPVQRIVYAQKNEANYCARCQTEGRLLADRALSRLLKSDWPRTLEELE